MQTRALPYWLFFCCFLVFTMVVVGAITRLTESGLSITEWQPVMGTIPPLNEAQWQRAFDLYQQTPEFRHKNFWMELADFKKIFFWEWAHRFLGRFIGLAYGLPLFWFWVRGQIPRGYKLKLFGVFVLGGLQGAMGWYMVQSGLIDRPAVSHYRLAAHLFLAFLIFAIMLWLGLSLTAKKKIAATPALKRHGWGALVILCLTILWGAFTAGLDGGLIYNESFPKMGGYWIPPEAFISLTNNPAGVQFVHRWLAMLTLAAIFSFWLHGRLKKNLFLAFDLLLYVVLLQVGLGLLTLLSGVWIPVAVLHQAGALILLTALLTTLHRLKSP